MIIIIIMILLSKTITAPKAQEDHQGDQGRAAAGHQEVGLQVRVGLLYTYIYIYMYINNNNNTNSSNSTCIYIYREREI